jgi:hypothetical protein
LDPFRDDNQAALIRAARLEEENERLRRELEEAKKPKPSLAPLPTRAAKNPRSLFVVVTGAVGMALAFGTVVSVLTQKPPEAPAVVANRKWFDLPTPTTPAVTVEAPPKPDWEQVPDVTSVDLHDYTQGNVPAVGYAVGRGGTILRHYAVEGSGWTLETSGTTRDLSGVAEMLGVVCAVGTGGVAVCSRDPAKVTWKAERTGTSQDLLGAFGFGELTAVGRNGTIVHRDERGMWSVHASGTKADLFATASAAGSSYAVGAGGVIVRRDGLTSRWSPVPSGTTEDLLAVAVEDHGVVVVGAHGTLLRLTDPRAGFRVESSGTTEDLYGVTHGRGYDFIAVGAAGTIVRSRGEGEAWQAETGGGGHTLRAVVGAIPMMFIVGDAGTVLRHRY